MLDFYAGIVDVIQGRVAKASGAAELNAALHDILGGIWMSLEDEMLRAEFTLRRPEGWLAAVAPDGRVQIDDPMPSGWRPKLATTPRRSR